MIFMLYVKWWKIYVFYILHSCFSLPLYQRTVALMFSFQTVYIGDDSCPFHISLVKEDILSMQYVLLILSFVCV